MGNNKKDETLVVRVPGWLRRKAERAAEKDLRSVSSLVALALKLYLDNAN